MVGGPIQSTGKGQVSPLPCQPLLSTTNLVYKEKYLIEHRGEHHPNHLSRQKYSTMISILTVIPKRRTRSRISVSG